MNVLQLVRWAALLNVLQSMHMKWGSCNCVSIVVLNSSVEYAATDPLNYRVECTAIGELCCSVVCVAVDVLRDNFKHVCCKGCFEI